MSLGIKFLYVGADVCLKLPSDSTSRLLATAKMQTPLPSAVAFPLLGRLGDLHPLEYVLAGRTNNRGDSSRAAPTLSLAKQAIVIAPKSKDLTK